MKYGLTKNQQKYFNFISKYIQENAPRAHKPVPTGASDEYFTPKWSK